MRRSLHLVHDAYKKQCAFCAYIIKKRPIENHVCAAFGHGGTRNVNLRICRSFYAILVDADARLLAHAVYPKRHFRLLFKKSGKIGKRRVKRSAYAHGLQGLGKLRLCCIIELRDLPNHFPHAAFAASGNDGIKRIRIGKDLLRGAIRIRKDA